MKRHACKACVLLLVGLVVVAGLVLSGERKKVVGESSTSSPDGNWALQLRLVEYSTLLNSRRVLDADLVHLSRPDWSVRTSVPVQQSDALTISNEDPDHPVAWSADSSAVSYWIHDQLRDTMRIEADEEKHLFERDLLRMRASWNEGEKGE